MKLPRGVGYITKDHVKEPLGIWVDCIHQSCFRRDRLAGDQTRYVSSEAAQEIFESKGWSVKPTLCPEHQCETKSGEIS